MSRVAALGEDVRVAGYALAGAEVHARRRRRGGVRRRGLALADDVACLILTPGRRSTRSATACTSARTVVWAVLPP